MQLGVAYDEPGLITVPGGNNVQGILGIAFQESEAQVAFQKKKPYKNAVGALKDQGFIKAMAYSLSLEPQGQYLPPLVNRVQTGIIGADE